MINETKRDVFDEVRRVALQDETLLRTANIHVLLKQDEEWHSRYDAALPDDLPVIPKAVGEYIKNLRKYHRDLVDVFGMLRDLGITRTEPTGVLVWVTHNTDTFARAWVLGVWRVEETGEIVKLEAEK